MLRSGVLQRAEVVEAIELCDDGIHGNGAFVYIVAQLLEQLDLPSIQRIVPHDNLILNNLMVFLKTLRANRPLIAQQVDVVVNS